MANNNIMDIAALLKSYDDDVNLSRGVLNINNDQAKSLNEIYAAYNAMRKEQENISPRTRDWLKENYGIVGETNDEIQEQLAVLKELGQGKSKGMEMLKGASVGADIGSKIAQMLPETKETLVAGPRGFGVVSRR
jgi:hypothetical protein